MDANKSFIRQTYNTHSASWCERIRSGGNWAHENIEKPAMLSLLPVLSGLDILLVGCGSGEEAVSLLDKNPKSVTGIDLSENLVALATTFVPGATFSVMDFDDTTFAPGTFDFIYSSLALHYSHDLRRTFSELRRIVKNQGRILFSIHHPLLWGAETERSGPVTRRTFGYERDIQTGSVSTYGDYFTPRWINDVWFDKMPIRYFHQTIGDTLTALMASGFSLLGIKEPIPCGGGGVHSAVYSKIPAFLIISAKAD